MYFWPRLCFPNILEVLQQMLRLRGTISHSIIHQQKKNVWGFDFRKWRLWQSTWIKAVDCSYSVGELASGCKSYVKVTLLLTVRIVFIFVLLVAGSTPKLMTLFLLDPSARIRSREVLWTDYRIEKQIYIYRSRKISSRLLVIGRSAECRLEG